MLTAISAIRPNRITDVKDESYHNMWGRFNVGAYYNNPLHALYLLNIIRNEMFYQGKQWIFTEDIETFLQDESGETRNRLMIVKNMIKPIVEAYRGNGINMDIGASAKSISPASVTRFEKSLETAQFYREVAKRVPQFANAIKQGRAVGDTPQETEQIHQNVYVDGFVEGINDLMEWVAELNRLQSMPLPLAESLAFGGLATIFDYEYAGNQRFMHIPAKDFFWDRNARKNDLTDSQGMGHVEYWSPTQVYESCPNLTDDQRKVIETYDKRMSATGNGVGMTQDSNIRTGIPVVFTIWKDVEPKEYGYVKNGFGDFIFTEINYTDPGELKPKYTTKDVVTPPNTFEARQLMKMEGKIFDKPVTCKRFPQVWRYVKFIPWQASPNTSQEKQIPDTVLEWGLLPYQENALLDYNESLPCYKNFCWSYLNGEVISPIDDAIAPQRFINRSLSVMDQQVSNSGGQGQFIDSDMFSDKDAEREAAQAMNAGKPVFVGVKGRGIQNVVMGYDNTMKSGAMELFNLVEGLSGVLMSNVGTNEEMQGQTANDNGKQAVGFTQLMIQRGSLVQEPFYNCISEIMLQCYQSIASRGKRIYIDNQSKLVKAVGDDSARFINLSQGMKLEEFRVFVKRDNNPEMLVQAGDQMLLQLLQMQMIDQPTYANLYGRSTPTMIANALRDFSKKKAEMSRMQAQADQQQQQQQIQMLQQEQQQQAILAKAQQDHEDLQEDKKAANKSHDILLKAQAQAAYNPKN